MQVCKTCNEEKELDAYYKYPNSTTGRHKECKRCQNTRRVKNAKKAYVPKIRSTRRPDEAKLAKATALLKQGKRYTEVAAAIGITTVTLKNWRDKGYVCDKEKDPKQPIPDTIKHFIEHSTRPMVTDIAKLYESVCNDIKGSNSNHFAMVKLTKQYKKDLLALYRSG